MKSCHQPWRRPDPRLADSDNTTLHPRYRLQSDHRVRRTFSAFATPQLIGGGRVSTVATMVYQLGFSSMNFPFAAALSIAGLILTILLLMALKRMTRFLHAMREH